MNEEGIHIIEKPKVPQVTPESIQETMQSISLFQDMVREILVRDIDYGRIPGTPQDSLWDPGASKTISSFNCYCGQRRILRLDDNETRIVVCVEVPLISRRLQQEVGSGIGAASTLETKYKYRWVAHPKEWGYDDDAIKTFKTKRGREDGRETTLYRIPNPEHSELLNTIIKMASKRAEVDAAESLPGVSSVLRQMFSGKPIPKGRQTAEDDYSSPRWQRFWGEVTRLGYTEQEAHAKFGVKSMHDWLAQNHTLDEALSILRRNDKPAQLGNSANATDKKSPATEAWPQPMDEDFSPLFDDSAVKSPIDKDWLNESLKPLMLAGWNVTAHIHQAYPNAKGKTIGEAIDTLTAEQRREFVGEVQKRLEAKVK
jgi:hypothetical protein